ncbi:MAG: DL-endopeptidase inhibitor IseA family protein [Oscillospiraceae bacterium]|nr:DL-endopeptidase inhibitor IseA family protein [Oscillospiraceae bacterium]
MLDFKKSTVAFLLSLILMLSFSGCADTQSNEIEPQNSSQVEQSSEKTDSSLQSSSLKSKILERGKSEIITDEELIRVFNQLMNNAVPAINWWLGIADYTLEDWGIQLDGSPYLYVYYPVEKLNSIQQLKNETEKVFTTQFGELFLYTVLDEDILRFIEYNGKVYVDITQGGFGLPYGEIENPRVKSKTENEAIITVTVYEYGLKKDMDFDFILKKEDNQWKMNSFFDVYKA